MKKMGLVAGRGMFSQFGVLGNIFRNSNEDSQKY